MKVLSVIIVAYNCIDYVKKCVTSIFNFNDIGDKLEVIIVDNGTDETYKWFQENCYDVIAIKNTNNGFGEGNNVGASLAKGKYLLFLNPDTELIEPIFQYAISKFENNNVLGSFGVQLLNADRKKGPSFGIRLRMGVKQEICQKVLVRFNIFIPDMMYTSGADLFIRSELFKQIGGFDESIFMYLEESDIANRINRAKYKISFYKDKAIVHYEGGASDNSLVKQYTRELKSRKYYCKKYGLNFRRLVFSEIAYCEFKRCTFGILNNKARSKAYADIVELLRCQLEGE